MAVPAQPSVYTGTAGNWRGTEQILWSTAEDYMPKFRLVTLNQTPALKAFSLKAFGKTDVIPGGSYGNLASKRSSTGKGIKFTKKSYQFSGPVYTSTPTGTHVGRMGNVNPEYLSPNNGFAYAYKRIYWSIYLPEELVKDNKGPNQLLDIMEDQMKLAQAGAVNDVNNILLGNSSAPTSSPYGLPYLTSVTQDTSIGGLDPTSTTGYDWWQNQYRACTSVGGGGQLDRPLVFLRKLDSLLLDVRVLSQSSDDQLLLATRGAYQYYRRAVYADTTAQGNGGLRNASYDAAGIDHIVFANCPMIYDPAVTVPYGATASTEVVYAQDLNEMGLAIRQDEFFDLERWDAPRTKDQQRFYQMNIWLRYTPFVSNRRIQAVLYNLPANADAS